jgi:hypothetical protein
MAGRPSKYKTEYAEQAYKLCLLGATDKEMSDILGVTESTFNLWKQEHKEFSESLKKGKEQADAIVAQKLYHRAIGYEHPEIITASYQGMITDTKVVTKHYAPDPTAAIFWLKNRQPKKWRDKQDVELSGKDGAPIELRSMTDADLEAALEQEIQKRGYVKP